jgi:phosphate-selective porin OprO/OprP
MTLLRLRDSTSKSRHVCHALLVAALATVPGTAAAQTADAPPFTAGWRDGFAMQTENGDYRLQFGLVAQADGRWVLDDDADAVVDTFSIRKMRPTLSGRIARYFDFQVMPDFGNGTTVLQDAYLDVRFFPALRVRMGKSKTPIGYEILIGDPFVFLPERALASSLVPIRDVGVYVLGEAAAGRLSYQGGVFNGIPDGTSSSSDVDTNDSKDLVGRFVVQPFRTRKASAASGLGFALGASSGRQLGSLPAFRTSVGQRYFAYDATASAGGPRSRVSPSVFYYYKSFGGFAEYMRSTQAVARAGTRRDVTNEAWEVTGSLVVTGEAASDRAVRPRANFDPAAGQWGALQLLARYGVLSVDDAVFGAGLAAAGASREARQFSIGANWYPVQFIRYLLFYERVAFDGGAQPRPTEHSIIVRAQVAF